jgi:glycosyltransferase involved in cell wall biosynthesis
VFCHIGIANYYFGLLNGASKFSFSPYSVDSPRFVLERLEPEAKRHRRAELGLDPDIAVIVFSGKLQPWKRPQDVLLAVAQAALPLQIVFMGDGPLMQELQSLASQVGARAHFVGFINQAEIPKWYAVGDVLVLPSGPGGDTWGLVVNEALASGLTPVVSDAVPSWPDFAWGPGHVFPTGDVVRLAECMVAALEQRKLTEHHQALALLSSRYSLEEAARGIEAAVETSVVHSKARER